MDPAVVQHGRRRTARARQRGDRSPPIRIDVVDVGQRVGSAVLLDEAAEGPDARVVRRHRDVVGAARQRRAVEPSVLRWVVDVVVVAIDRPFAIAADDVQATASDRGPCHLAARDRQRSTRPPSSGWSGRRGAVDDTLRLLLGREVMRHTALQTGIRR